MQQEGLTYEHLVYADLPFGLEQRLWTILAADSKTGPKFYRLLVGNKTPDERCRYINLCCPNSLALSKWMSDIVGAVERVNPKLAVEFVSTLMNGSPWAGMKRRSFNDDIAKVTQLRRPQHHMEYERWPPNVTCVPTLAQSQSQYQGFNQHEHPSVILDNVCQSIHHTSYFNECREHNDVSPNYMTGSRRANKGSEPCHSRGCPQYEVDTTTSKQDIVFPPLPELEGDNSFIQECDDFLYQLRHPPSPSSEKAQAGDTTGQAESKVVRFPLIQLITSDTLDMLSLKDQQAIESFRQQQNQKGMEKRAAKEVGRKRRGIRTRSEDQLEERNDAR